MIGTGSAYAACPQYTFTNGYTADANQINANFTCIFSNPSFTGPVGIGTTAPGYALDVNGAVHSNNDFYATGGSAGFQAGDRTGGSNVSWFYRNAGITYLYDDTFGNVLGYNTSGQVVIGPTSFQSGYVLTINGNAFAVGGTWQASDKRLKKDVSPISDALSVVERLNPVEYRWRAVDERTVGKALDLPVGKREVGFIAQEVADVLPEAVTAPKKGTDGVYSLQEEAMIPLLVQAMKEQQVEIEQLKSTVASLKTGK